MRYLKRVIAGTAALAALMTSAASCGKGSESSSGKESSVSNEHYKPEDEVAVSKDDEVFDGLSDAPDISGQTIVWLADYGLNPLNNNDRSVALALFEDVYGCKVKDVIVSSDKKFDSLANMINSGDQVDMFPYEWDAVPDGVSSGQYDPLDPYFDSLGMDSGIWDDMEDVIDMMKYSGQHYVIPYTICDPLLITYSRKLMQENGLEDPYELYCEGKWDWDVFMDMMKDFTAGSTDAAQRYGICGWFGQAVIQSTGHTVINYEDGKFINNIDDPEIEKAELLMQEIAAHGLYVPGWAGFFPNDQSTLFYAMADWTLGTSNAQNEGMDLMVVPFPKAPEADEYYLCCNYGAKMLVKGSEHGDAVAAYIKCERLAEYSEEYREAAKQKALIVEKTAGGVVRSYITEEQYDAIQEYRDPDNIVPMFDFGYGMGESMYKDGYTYDTRGVMNNLTNALLEGCEEVDSWAKLREQWTGVIDTAVEKYNSLM